jgi:plasmid replication initiation protein
MKMETTRKRAPTSRKVAEQLWTRCWNDMSRARIRRWIEKIPYHIQEIIRLKRGNDYKYRRVFQSLHRLLSRRVD